MTGIGRGLLASGLTLLLTACSGQFWVNTFTPRWGYARHADIAYGALDRQRLDVYVPNGVSAGTPVVIFFHGGSWQSGAKEDYRFVDQALAALGFIAIVPDYRLYPPTTFPGFVEDGARAVAWARRHAGDYGGNACSLVVAGHSAGAHIGAMLATDGSYLADAGASIDDLVGFIGLAGPYDFLPITAPVLQTIFAPRASWPASQPIRFVDGDEPPMLLLHGADDQIVAVRNTKDLASTVAAAGGAVEVKIYPGVGHIGLLAPLAAPLRFLGDQRKVISDFITRHVSDKHC